MDGHLAAVRWLDSALQEVQAEADTLFLKAMVKADKERLICLAV